METKDHENLSLNQTSEYFDEFESLLNQYYPEADFDDFDEFDKPNPLETEKLIGHKKEPANKPPLTPEDLSEKLDKAARKEKLSDYEITNNKIKLKNEFGDTLKSFDLRTDEDHENWKNSILFLHSYRITAAFLLLCLPFALAQLGQLKKLGFFYFLASLPIFFLSAIIPSFILWGIILSLPHLFGWEYRKDIPMRKIILVASIAFLIAALLFFFSPTLPIN
ncbi:MAG: hypothetical protein VB047_00095 [Anaerotignum propionicum]|uniref:hypothetical protein n=1 Tax=Anaerotignum propionicum TaxID=28446 RepID=UPI002B1F0514|nr:hypothetical protein [Anaerotignum propionicum]MEA5055946.1 hypothetical protein [Anaerotignum propionicum]